MRLSFLLYLLICTSSLLATQGKMGNIPGLVSIKVEKIGDDAQIEWTMEEAFLMRDFVVERSLDNAEFSAVGLVAAGGSMKRHDTYGFMDENIVAHNAQTIYYRIVQIGQDGRNFHSQSVGLSQLETKGIILDYFANPEKPQVVNIAYLARGEGELLMQIVNGEGRVLLYDELPKGEGFQVKELRKLPRGTYFIKIFDDEYAVQQEMIIE